jgi:ribose transport system permease protein
VTALEIDASPSPSPRTEPGGGPRTFRQTFNRLQARFPILQLIVLVITIVLSTISLPGLLTFSSIQTILVLCALTGLASLGQTLLILMGGFDLSVAGIMVASALCTTAIKGVSFGEGLVFAILGAAFLGALAGQICHRFRIQPLIVTFATGTIAAGVLQVIDGGSQTGESQQWVSDLSGPTKSTLGIPFAPVVFIWVLVTIALVIFMHRTPTGRRILGTGASPLAAELTLINTRRVWTLAFMASAIASALVGILVGGFAGSITSTVANPYTFQSVVAVVIGGTVFGGPGGFTRTAIGTVILTVAVTAFVGNGASYADQYILNGVVLLIALTAYGRRRRVRDRV